MIDTIILAAGENVRLQAAGLAPGMKPLLIVENEVLIKRLCRQAREVTDGEIIIVANASNARDVVYASQGYDAQYVIQPWPLGPCDAVERALRMSRAEHILLLMGDNVIRDMPHMPIEQAPLVTVTCTPDDALHKMRQGEFVDDGDADAYWLGPVLFAQEHWCEGASSWTRAFKWVQFTYVTADVKDIGVLR